MNDQQKKQSSQGAVVPTTATSANTDDKQTAAPSTSPDPTENQSDRLQKINRAFKEKETSDRAKQLGLSYINIAITLINPDLLKLIPPEVAKPALILPFYKTGKKIRVAVADPENSETKKVIEQLRAAGFEININLASDDGLLEAMKLYRTDQYKVKKEIDTSLEEKKIKTFEKEIVEIRDLREKITNVTSEEAVYLINVGAYKTGASDMHFEPEENGVRVRFRIDGMLHDIFQLDKGVYSNLANQIKYQSKMKLNILSEPQDGRYSFLINQKKVDVRVSSLPTEYGETFVCRLLDSERIVMNLDDLGFTGRSLAHIKQALKIKNGMILVTGPTGSGKTTTLYAILDILNKPELKIITLEDPIEYHMKGVSQSQVNEKKGYDFANGLRAILRQDPDIVMIGEIRDLETAETASQASLTGHVILSTLHTNSAIEAISRLMNIGIPPFLIAPSLDTIIGQRLVRKFCPDCAELKTIAPAKMDEMVKTLEVIKKIQPSLKLEIPKKLPISKGCAKCSHTGYKGRVSITEVLNVDNEMKRLILEKSSSTKLIEAARRKGMLTMYEDGIIKVINGVTSLTEVRRVTAISI